MSAYSSHMGRDWIEYGPRNEPVEITCPNRECHNGQVGAGAFAKHGTRDCEECGGTGLLDVDPDDLESYDTRDHDEQKGDR